MNCYMCNSYTQNGVLKNGKILCDSCNNKLGIFMGNNVQYPKNIDNTKSNSNQNSNKKYDKCPKCQEYALTSHSEGFGCVTGKGQRTTTESCYKCNYYNSETEYFD